MQLNLVKIIKIKFVLYEGLKWINMCDWKKFDWACLHTLLGQEVHYISGRIIQTSIKSDFYNYHSLVSETAPSLSH